MNRWEIKSLALAVLAVMLLNGCSSTLLKAQRFSEQGEWMKAVIEYRKAYADDPSNVEYKSRLIQAEWRAAEFYYQRGEKLLGRDDLNGANLDAAIAEFQQGMSAMPSHEKLRQGMNAALARKDAELFYQEGLRLGEGGKKEDAVRSFQKALQGYPGHVQAKHAAALYEKQIEDDLGAGQLSLSSQAPITLNFRQAEIRSAFEFIANSFGVNIIFDESLKSVPVTLFAKNVSFEQALNLLLMTTRTFYKKIGVNIILISQDTRDKRNQYEDLLLRTFYLNNVKAREMAETLRGMLIIKKMVVDEQLNTLLIRDSEEVMKIVEKLINIGDRKPAEVVLEVEVLEVNRSKAERLGLDLGSYEISASVPGTVLLSGSISSQVKSKAVLTLPGAAFRFFKQDVDGKTLANPKIRVLSGKAAKIHIGDRVPLRASTVTESTGQIRTTFDYKEIGIRLNVEPIINLDNSSTVKLSLEVSTLGENFGTTTDPAFKIGTRNAETVMLLRDNETAILGGLIRDEDRNLKVRVPVIGDIPVLGEVFSAHDNAAGRTDVLLTITPRVVRGWDLASEDMRNFNSGTEEQYLSQSLYASLGKPAVSNKATQANAAPVPLLPTEPAQPIQPAPAQPAEPSQPMTDAPPLPLVPQAGLLIPVPLVPVPLIPVPLMPVLAFNESVYQASVGQDFEVLIKLDILDGMQSAVLDIQFDPEVLSFISATSGELKSQNSGTQDSGTQAFKASADAGILHIASNIVAGQPEQHGGTVARVTLRGVKPGISNLTYRGSEIKTLAGATLAAQSRPSSVFIK